LQLSTLFPYTTLFRSPQHAENPVLQLEIVNTNRAAAQLVAVEHDVIALRAHAARIALELIKILIMRHRERVMHERPAARILVPVDRKSTRLNSSHVKI